MSDISKMSIDELEGTVERYNPYDPVSPSLEADKREPLPDFLSSDEMAKAYFLGRPETLSNEEMFAPPKLTSLDKVVGMASRGTRMIGKGIWKAVGALSWPFVRIEAGIATPSTAIAKTVTPLFREPIKAMISEAIYGPTAFSKPPIKEMIRNGLTPYARELLGDNLETTIDDLAEQIVTRDFTTKKDLDEALGESKSALSELLPSFYHGAKSFVPFTRNDPEKVKNFNDMWGTYYETMTDEKAPEWIKQTSGIATSFLVTPTVFGKILRTGRTGTMRIPVVKRWFNRKLPAWQEAKLIRKANMYERTNRAQELGKKLADKDVQRIAKELSLKTGKTITPQAVKLRLGQIIKGSITEQELFSQVANPVMDEFSHNFKELQKLGILGEETYLTKLSKKRVSELVKKKGGLQTKLTKLQEEVPYKETLIEKVANLSPDKAKQQRMMEKFIDVAVKAEERGKKLADVGDEFIDVAIEVTTGSPLSKKIATLMDFAPGDKRLSNLGKRILALEKMERVARNKHAKEILKVAAKINPKVSKYTQQTINDVLKVADQIADSKVVGQWSLLKYIEKMKYRFPGKAENIKGLQSKIDEINEKIWLSKMAGSEKYMPRMYQTKEAQAATRKFPVKGGPKVRAPYAKGRQDIPLEVRKEMGEMLEPAYPVTKRLIQESQDIETAKMFKFAAEHGDWVDDVWREGLHKTPLPDTKSYGALKGKFVTPQIHNDVAELVRIRSDFESLYDSMIGSWKLGKTVANPATHFRNMMSNSILLDLSGTDHIAQSKLFVKALKEIKAGSEEYKTAQKFFARSTLISGELLDDMLRTVQADKASGLQKSINAWNKFISTVSKKPSQAYQSEEFIFKFMKYIEQRERGKSVLGAVQEANKWLFDYGDLSRFEKVVARRVMPFYTFQRKALPRVLETAADRPLTLAKYPLLAWAEEKYALHKLELTDEDYDQIQKVLPEYMQRGSYLLMPFRDTNGDLQFFDWTYIVPWGELFDAQDRGLLSATITNPLFQTVADITRNKSGWSGREIYEETDTPEEKTFKQMLHVWQTAMPSLMYKGIYWDKMYESATGKPSKMGKIRPLAPTIAHTIFGLRTQAIDIEQQQRFNIAAKRAKVEELEKKMADIVVRFSNDNITEEEYEEKREQYFKQIQDILSDK